LRVIEAWGPFPIQPVVVRSSLQPELKEGLRASLLAVGADPRTRRAVSAFGLEGFVPVTDEDYAPDGESRSAILFTAISGREAPGRT
jgi:ABC-type phosphate/phosphonate transport system substrate-binding protein